MDQLTKSAYFLAVRMTFALERFCRLYIREIVRLHGVPVSIVSDRDLRFTAHFWKSFQKAMGTRLTRGVQWAVPPGLACGPTHYIVMLCRAGPVTVVGRAGTTRVSGPCRA